MGTRIPKAWETTWAQEAMKAERDRPADAFAYPGHDAEPSGEIIFLGHPDGQCRAVDAALVRTEHWRVSETMAQSAVAAGCSDNIISGPARGPIAEFREGYWVGEGAEAQWRLEPYRSGCPGRARDNFDAMTDQVARRRGRAPFTAGEVHAAREYRALVERLQSAGVKCSSAFDVKTGGKGKVDFMDAYMRDAERLRWFHEAIGDGVAKDTKRKVPAIEGSVTISHVQLREIGREMITVRRLVDEVCIRERALSDVLRVHGWSVAEKNRKTLRDALCAALGRMQGI